MGLRYTRLEFVFPKIDWGFGAVEAFLQAIHLLINVPQSRLHARFFK